MDARRKEVYAALYRIRDNGYPSGLQADQVASPESSSQTPPKGRFSLEKAPENIPTLSPT